MRLAVAAGHAARSAGRITRRWHAQASSPLAGMPGARHDAARPRGRPPRVPRVLTIASSDSGGGAGIQADLKAFARCGAHGMSAIVALTAQNTLGVSAIHEVPPDFARAQIDVVLDDLGADAAKTGMLFSAPLIDAVAGGPGIPRAATGRRPGHGGQLGEQAAARGRGQDPRSRRCSRWPPW